MKTYTGEFQNLKRVIHNLRGKKDNNANNARPIIGSVVGKVSNCINFINLNSLITKIRKRKLKKSWV